MSTRNPPFSVTYRAELMALLWRGLSAGECCSLVGTSGVGKSNFARFIQQGDVQAHYFPDEKTWIMVVDSNSLVFDDRLGEFEVLEAMIHSLIVQTEAHGVAEEVSSWVDKLYVQITDHPKALLALRTLERLCTRLCNQHDLQLVFVFDQFEDIWQSGPARLFLNLRHLRDLFRYRVVYLVMTRQPLEHLRPDYQDVEAFSELFSGHVYGLGMYGEHDAVQMMERLARRAGNTALPDKALLASLIEQTGGHPGLLRALFWAILETPETTFDIVTLLQIPSVADECMKIWLDLEPSERYVVRTLANAEPLDGSVGSVMAELQLKGIITGEPPEPFSRLFTTYVRDQSEHEEPGIIVNTQLHQVTIDGKPPKHPPGNLEFALLEYLARHAGSLCKNKDILDHLYPDEPVHGATDQRLDTTLSRLRYELGEKSNSPRYIVRVRMTGIKLVQGRVEE